MVVVKMMRWSPWPALCSRKFEAVVIVHKLEGTTSLVKPNEEVRSLVVEIKWKGQKGVSLRSLRRSMKRNFTRVVGLGGEGVVEWNQEFRNVCTLTGFKDNMFYPWEVMFTVSNVSNKGPKTVASVAGVTSINLAKYVTAAVDKETEIVVPLNVPGTNDSSLSLCLSLTLRKLETLQEYLDVVQRSMVCVPSSPSSPEAPSMSKGEFSTLKTSLRRVKILTDYVSTRRAKKASSKDEGSDGRSSSRSEDSEYRDTSDTDSVDNDAAIESEENKEVPYVRRSLSYGTLSLLNYVGGSPYTSPFFNGEDECWVYFSTQKYDCGGVHVENYNTHDHIEHHSSKNRILSWRKRKLNFRSLKAKGELLLKRHYGEEGGDDIDYDRRQLSSSDDYTCVKWHKIEKTTTTRQSFASEFEENSFTVGSWECKEITSRDGRMKLHTQVFFASIDQRSEHVAGEGACAVLVAMIADWLKVNQVEIPIKCEFDTLIKDGSSEWRIEFDTLIKDGSSEWRILCENKNYIKMFPDKHFDLDTVLQAKIHSISVLLEKSFVGFFIPEELEGGGFDFLQGAMSFDRMWEEISNSASELQMRGEPLVYIVGWNDHFFVLKVEQDAYYIIDTLGERLYEGCNKAYILKFDAGTTIEKLPSQNQVVDEKHVSVTLQINDSKENVVEGSDKREEIVCRGKDSCKEYIKSFLAAIPVRELQVEVKKGLKASKPLHRRLQIEFYYTQLKQPMMQYSTQEAKTIDDASRMAAVVLEVS